MSAARSGHAAIVEALIGQGATVDLRDSLGFTALMLAAEGGYIEIVDALLDAGASPDLQSRTGLDAIQMASGNRHVHYVERLKQFLEATEVDGEDDNATPSAVAVSPEDVARAKIVYNTETILESDSRVFSSLALEEARRKWTDNYDLLVLTRPVFASDEKFH